MASNTKFLEGNSFGNFDVNVTQNGMNESLVLRGTLNIINLVNFLISPPVLPSLFITPRDWLTSLQIFPFDVNVGVNNIMSGNLEVGGVVAKKNGGDDIDITKAEICYNNRLYNLGQAKIEPHFNNFADFNGYTKIQLYLPMFGLIDINPNDVMNKYIQIRMSVDVFSGMGVYYIGVSNNSISLNDNGVTSDDTNIDRILATYSFQIGYNVPIGSSDAPQVYRNIIGGAVKATAMAVGGYVASSAGAGVTTSSTTTVSKTSGSFTRSSPKTGRMLKEPGKWSRTETTDTTRTVDHSSYAKGKAITECFEYGSQALTSMHMSAQSDRVNNPAVLAEASESVQLIIYRPKIIPADENYNHLYGQPLGEVKELSELSGYTEITNIHIEDVGFDTATQEELGMLMQELSSGIIL